MRSRTACVERLEERRLLAITVTTLGDEFDGVEDGGISLREAIFHATEDETIDFAVTGTIQLESQLEISKSLSINGPGANLLTIRANGGGSGTGDGHRIFSIVNSLSDTDVTISGLRLAGGDVTGAGGAIWNEATLTIEDCLITDNAATTFGAGGGGAIYSHLGVLSVVSSLISGNRANGSLDGGGGLFIFGGDASIEHSFIRANIADGGRGGGVFATGSAQLDITGSTIAFNQAEIGGGASLEQASVKASNVTISGNLAFAEGGGVQLRLNHGDTARFAHTTIADNRSDWNNDGFGEGGGIYVDPSWSNEGPDLYHTIVAGNYKGTGNFQPADVVGSWSGDFFIVNQDALLGPLMYYGSDVPTHALLPDSPAIDAGDPNATAGVELIPWEDARGPGFARIFDGDGINGPRIDIGAFELQSGSLPLTLVVDTLLDENDGDYAVGDLSLREAIGLANRNHGVADTITFDAALAGGTIHLTLGELAITDSLAILGLGSRLLTIDASGSDLSTVAGDGSRIFHVDDGNRDFKSVITIHGLRLAGGDTFAGGGAIRNSENLTVSECEISGNAAVADGGGILAISGNLSVVDSIISGNSSHKDYATYGGGGGIATFSYLKLASSAVFGNVSAGHGGGILAAEGKLTITNSTISGNKSGEGDASPYLEGGGVFLGKSLDQGATDVLISHSTITANSSPATGAGIFIDPALSAVYDLSHAIVAGNLGGDLSGWQLNHQLSLVGGDPLLGPLGYHGGITPTHAPLAGSLAIDMGSSSLQPGVGGVPLYDQRGSLYTRFYGSAIDVGAHETQPPAVAGDANGDNVNNAADYTVWRNSFGHGVGIYTSGDLNGDGLVNHFDYAIWKSNFGSSLDGAGAGPDSGVRTFSTGIGSAAGATVNQVIAEENVVPTLAGSVEIAAAFDGSSALVGPTAVKPSIAWAVPLETRARDGDATDRRGRHGRMELVASEAKDLLLEALGSSERRFARPWRDDNAHCRPKDREVEDALVDSAIDALDFETVSPGVFGRKYRLRI